MHSARRLARLLLLPATGFLFVVFGLAGLLFYFPFGPWLRFRHKDPTERRQAARRLVAGWFGIFLRLCEALGTIRVVVKNPEALRSPGLLLAPNHPSLLDIVVLLSLLPNGTTVVKESLVHNSFTRAPIRNAGYLPNTLGAEALEHAREELASGASLVIFPEGTRTPCDLPEGTYPRMHRGIAVLALETDTPLTPVRITARPRWLTKEVAWWHLPDEPMTLTVEVLPSLAVHPYRNRYNDRIVLAARALMRDCSEALFGTNRASSSDSAPDASDARPTSATPNKHPFD